LLSKDGDRLVEDIFPREDEGISVPNCSPYIKEWMLREREEEERRTDWQ
jgi:hypothetical protein